MTAQRNYYVHLGMRWAGRGSSGQWVPNVGVIDIDDAPAMSHVRQQSVALYEVSGMGSRDAAAALVTHWLATGRPAIMNVREIWRRKT